MELRFWAATDVGRVRGHNEDNFLVDKRLQLFVVCDGMGGHAAGEVASAICVRTVRDVVAAEAELLARMRENPGDPVGRQALEELLGRAIRTASARIFEVAKQDSSKRGMGTTCITLVMAGDRGFVGHVGDSRLYRLREGAIEQVSVDHSLLNEMIRQGKIPATTTEGEFPHNNAVTRAVGVREAVEVDTFQFEVAPGDRLMMCSDGLSEYFRNGVDLMDLVGSDDPKSTTARCIEHANRSGGKDNITVVVVDYGAEQEDEEEKIETARVIEILRNTSYFHYLAAAELEHIRKLGVRVDYDPNETIVGEDRGNEDLIIILKGSVSLQLQGRQVSVLIEGEHFGEMSVIDAQDEQDTNLVAKALEPTVVLAIPRDKFVGMLRSAPGLAVKLLWNFVQVFADRLQAVPPQYRFGSLEWNSESEESGDETPPAGSLVFEEDIRRLEERSETQEEGPDLSSEEAPVSVGMERSAPEVAVFVSAQSEPELAASAEMDFGEVEEQELGSMSSLASAEEEEEDPILASRKTVDLGNVDFSRLVAEPPRIGASSGSNYGEETDTPPPMGQADDFEMPATGQFIFHPESFPVDLGTSQSSQDQDSDEARQDEDLTLELEGPPDVSDPREAFLGDDGEKDHRGEESSVEVEEQESESDPNMTLPPWENAASGEPWSGGAVSKEERVEESDDQEELGATVELSADVEHLKPLREAKSSSEALREKLRARMKKSRPAPTAEVLKKATGKFPVAKGEALPKERPEEKSGAGALSGSSRAEENKSARVSRPPVVEEPKVMISPDLMADFDED